MNVSDKHIGIDTSYHCKMCGHHHCLKCNFCHRCGCEIYIANSSEKKKQKKRKTER